MDILPKEELIALVTAKMPFGKYKGRYLVDLPDHYLIWFKQKGFPKGKLGDQLSSICDLQANGAEQILKDLKNRILK